MLQTKVTDTAPAPAIKLFTTRMRGNFILYCLFNNNQVHKKYRIAHGKECLGHVNKKLQLYIGREYCGHNFSTHSNSIKIQTTYT